MSLHPTPAEIRAGQERSVEAIEAQLQAGAEFVVVHDRQISREAAWAACASLRKSWELGGRSDGQERDQDGTWYARVHVPIGKFPG